MTINDIIINLIYFYSLYLCFYICKKHRMIMESAFIGFNGLLDKFKSIKEN